MNVQKDSSNVIGTILRIPEVVSSDVVKTIVEDASGQLWVGTIGGGQNKFDPDSGQFTRFSNDPKNPNSLVYDNIEAIAIDNKGNLWIGTIAGLDYFDPKAETFYPLPSRLK